MKSDAELITEAGFIDRAAFNHADQLTSLIALVRADERERLLQGVGELPAPDFAGKPHYEAEAYSPMLVRQIQESARLQGREEMRVACVKVCEDEAWRLKQIAVETQSAATNTKAIQAASCAAAIKEVRL